MNGVLCKFCFLFVISLASISAFLIAPSTTANAQRRRKPWQQSQISVESAVTADRLAEQNRWPEAIEAYKTLIRENPKNVSAYNALGDAYFNSGRWEEALAAYKEATRVAPGNAEAWYNLGYCYNAMGRHGEAFAPLVKAKDLDPQFAEAFYGIGFAYMRGTEIEKALQWFKSAINVDPEYADAYYGLALVYTRLGKSSLAEEARKKLQSLDPALIQKLDREIRTPASALAGPLPAITRIEPTENPPKRSPAAENSEPATSSSNERGPATARDLAANQPPNTSQPPQTETNPAREKSAEPEPEAAKQPSNAVVSDASPPASANGPAPAAAATSPVATGPVAVLPPSSKRWAVVIGVDNYGEEQISPWQGSANDARSLRDALIQYAGFPTDQVILLSSDQPLQKQPSRSVIVQSLNNLRDRVPRDGLLLVSFAGHGIERNGRSYLIPSDAPEVADLALLESVAINVERLKELIRATGASQVMLILDAARNDPMPGRSGDNLMTSNFVRSFNFDVSRREVTSFATLFAAEVGQRAYDYNAKKQGYFTLALIDGLRGEAANEKGEVTLAGLVKYMQETVPRYVHRDLGPEKQQVPSATMEGYKADELVIANRKSVTP